MLNTPARRCRSYTSRQRRRAVLSVGCDGPALPRLDRGTDAGRLRSDRGRRRLDVHSSPKPTDHSINPQRRHPSSGGGLVIFVSTTAMARRALVSLVVASALAACGGGSGSGSSLPGTSSVPPATPATTLPPLARTPSSTPASMTVTAGSPTPFVSPAATAGTAGHATSLTASLASAPAAGSLIVAFIGTGDASAVTTPPSGWSAAADASGHACQAMSGGANAQGEQVYVHTAAAGEGATKYTF